MSARLLSARPIADDYRSSLSADLEHAQLVRFSMAYISSDGVNALGEQNLLRALKHADSFGYATLSCGCGFEPLCRLQERLGEDTVRLKYFVDPQVVGPDLAEPAMELMHSKLIYLVREDRAVIYVGSHNWSARALGPSAPRNAEASLRLEYDFDEQQLEGRGGDLPSQVNWHLRYGWSLAICRPATEANRSLFEDWRHLCCERGRVTEERDRYAVVTCVLSAAPGAAPGILQTTARTGLGIYGQFHEEGEGKLLRELQDRVLLLVWPTLIDLERSRSPVLLYCRSTSHRAGPRSELRGKSKGDITNFDWVLWDAAQHTNALGGRMIGEGRTAVVRRSGLVVRFFDLDAGPPARQASSIDQTAEPPYQHFLQVDEVVLPGWLTPPSGPQGDQPAIAPDGETLTHDGVGGPVPACWMPGDVAFSEQRTVKEERLRGYRVDPQVDRHIRQELRDEFRVSFDRAQAKALPFSGELTGREGRHVSTHPIHEAMLDEDVASTATEFYARRELGAVVPDLEAAPAQRGGRPLPRVQRLWGESRGALVGRIRSRAGARRRRADGRTESEG